MRVLFLLALAASPAYAGKQGTACKSNADCSAPLTCAPTGKPKCELVCDDKTTCPADQRCVSDHGTRVCRPVNDGLDL